MSEVTSSAALALDREVMPAPDPCAACGSPADPLAFGDKFEGVVTVSAIVSLVAEDFVESLVNFLRNITTTCF